MRAGSEDTFKIHETDDLVRPLISVECYSDSIRESQHMIGVGQVDVRGRLKGQELQLIGMFNMAFAASHIPTDTTFDNAGDYEKGLFRFIQDQCKAITGEDIKYDDLLVYIMNIKLPEATAVSDHLEDYYRLAIEQLKKSA